MPLPLQLQLPLPLPLLLLMASASAPAPASIYAVSHGRCPGIYRTWKECQSNVVRFPNAKFRKFPHSHVREAEFWIATNQQTKNITTANVHTKAKRKTHQTLYHGLEMSKRFRSFSTTSPSTISIPTTTTTSIPTPSTISIPTTTLYCDGGSNAMTRANGSIEAWASVVDQYGNDVIEKNKHVLNDLNIREAMLPVGKRSVIIANGKDVTFQNNNYAELLAMLAAMRIALHTEHGKHVERVYTDSELVIMYWSKNHVKRETREKMDTNKAKCIEEVAKLRKQFEQRGGQVIKVSGAENLADLGYH